MHDIFDPKLEKEAKALGITRVPAVWIEKAGAKPGFLCARTTEPWIFKAGVRLVADLEQEPRKDSLHHRSSGLDSTTAKLCADHDILVAIDVSILRTLDPTVMGRTMQNITLCRRYGAKMCVISNATHANELLHAPDVHGLLVSLGMSQGEATSAINALGEVYTTFAHKK
jgi:hypothetical protein